MEGEDTKSIFRVPKSLSKEMESAYMPEMVPLGLFFLSPSEREDAYPEMKAEKKGILDTYLSKCESQDALRMIANGSKVQKELLNQNNFSLAVIKSESCYNNITWSDKDVEAKIHLLMLDAAFVLNKLKSLIKERKARKRSVIILTEIVKDILKLENQIPLCVLRAFHAEIKPNRDDLDFMELLKGSLSLVSPFHSNSNARESLGSINFEDCDHLLECCRKLILGETNSDHKQHHSAAVHDSDVEKQPEIDLPSAAELGKAGIRFKPLPPQRAGIKHIYFDRKSYTLYLPRMSMGLVYSEVIWRNLIAFELCSTHINEKAVVSFIHLMDDLINTKEDVRVFVKSKIFVHVRSDERVAQFWNTLCHSTRRPAFGPIDRVAEEMMKIYEYRTWRTLWSEFLELYFWKPWMLMSAIAATFLLLLTVVQVGCTFYTCH